MTNDEDIRRQLSKARATITGLTILLNAIWPRKAMGVADNPEELLAAMREKALNTDLTNAEVLAAHEFVMKFLSAKRPPLD